jgi:hypothetical protein
MTFAKDIEQALSGDELPLELRRAWTSHPVEDRSAAMILNGTALDRTDKDDLIPSHLARQNLVVPAYPFRAASLPRRIKH